MTAYSVSVRRLLMAALASSIIVPPASALDAGAIASSETVDQLLSSAEPAQALQQVYDLRDAVWQKMPLSLARAVFVEGDVAGYRTYQPRATTRFSSNDTLRVYLEPVGYGFRETAADATIDLSVDIAITNPSGQVIVDQMDFARIGRTLGEKSYEFGATIALTIASFPAGDYDLAITLNDLASDKTATISLPFAIKADATE